MLVEEEGLDAVYARHRFLAEGVRAAVAAWSLDNLCENPARVSDTLTAIVMPDGFDPAKSKGLGMRIVSSFVRQLQADLDVRNHAPGTEFVISIPLAAAP